MSEISREALIRSIVVDPEWEALLTRIRARAQAMGIHSEEDVERLSDEYRREKRASHSKHENP